MSFYSFCHKSLRQNISMSVDYEIRECAAILCDTYFQDPLRMLKSPWANNRAIFDFAFRLCFRKMLMIWQRYVLRLFQHHLVTAFSNKTKLSCRFVISRKQLENVSTGKWKIKNAYLSFDRKSYLFYGTINKNYEMICYINSLAIDEVETCCYFDK